MRDARAAASRLDWNGGADASPPICRLRIGTVGRPRASGCGSERVLTASDGEEALARARKHQPSLILLDMMTPGIDGFSFPAAPLQAPEPAEIPVPLMSALREEQLQPRLGAVPVLSKPIEIDELIT